MKKPPALAAWLLRTLGSGPLNDPLLGDLSEEYASGRSTRWFWCQVLIGIVVSFARECRAHTFVVIRAVLLSIAIGYLSSLAAAPVVSMLSLTLTHSLLIPGWLYMQWQLYEVVSAAVWFHVAIAGGWIVARVHRRHQRVAILAAFLAIAALLFLNQRFFFLMRNAWTHERFLPYLALHVAHSLATLAGFLIGGLWLTRARAEAPARGGWRGGP